MNNVQLIGNLTRSPEVRFTPAGKAVCELGLAVTTKFKDTEDTCFVSVTVWDKQAETCGEFLDKGSPVLVEGRLKLDTWEKDGQKRSKISVVARRVQFLGKPRGEQDRDAQGGPVATRHPDTRNEAEQQAQDDTESELPF